MKMLNVLFREAVAFSEAFVRVIPRATGVLLRRFWYRRRFQRCGKISPIERRHVWIGAGAVVTTDVSPLGVAVGVPAEVIKFRGDRERTRDG